MMQDNPYGVAAMWAQGDALSKGVAITLLAMSVVSWCVILVKAWRLVQMRRMAKQAAQDFWHAQSFADGVAKLTNEHGNNPFRNLAEEGADAVHHHADNKDDLHGALNISDWVTSNLRRTIDEASQHMQSGLTVLASIGSTAPFVGLLGTVWGIYHALIGISISGAATIDKVAGPVGEALIMTAFGLAVAIPAVLAYNALTRGNKSVLAQLNRFAHELHAFFVTGARLTKSADGKPRLSAVGEK